MPTYEYRCDACSRIFVVQMSIAEHENAQILCPACRAGSTQTYSAFFAKTSKKS